MSHFTYVPNEEIDPVMVELAEYAAQDYEAERPKCHPKQLKLDAKKQGYLFTNKRVPCPCCSQLYPKALVFKKGNRTIIACVCGYRRKE